MSSTATGFLPEHDVYPPPSGADRAAVGVWIGAFVLGSMCLGPNALVLLSWAGLAAWGTIKHVAHRRAEQAGPAEPDQP